MTKPNPPSDIQRFIDAAVAAERECCAGIAHERGLQTHPDFRWLADEIEAEIRHG